MISTLIISIKLYLYGGQQGTNYISCPEVLQQQKHIVTCKFVELIQIIGFLSLVNLKETLKYSQNFKILQTVCNVYCSDNLKPDSQQKFTGKFYSKFANKSSIKLQVLIITQYD